MGTLAAARDRSAWDRLAARLKPEGRAFIAGPIDKYSDLRTIWTAYA